MYELTLETVHKAIFEFKNYLVGITGSFTTNLYKTIICADPTNKTKLAMAFPAQVLASTLYHDGTFSSMYKYYKIDGKPLEYDDICVLGKLIFGSDEILRKAWCIDEED